MKIEYYKYGDFYFFSFFVTKSFLNKINWMKFHQEKTLKLKFQLIVDENSTLNKTSQIYNITKFQYNLCEHHKTICPCEICGLQSVKMGPKINK